MPQDQDYTKPAITQRIIDAGKLYERNGDENGVNAVRNALEQLASITDDADARRIEYEFNLGLTSTERNIFDTVDPDESASRGDASPGDASPGDSEAGGPTSSDVDPGDQDSESDHSGDASPGDADHGDADHGDADHGDTDHGDTDHGDTDWSCPQI